MSNRVTIRGLFWAVVAACVFSTSVQAAARHPGDNTNELRRLQLQFPEKGHLEAYERYTRGLGKGSVEIRCSEEILLPDQKVSWVTVVYTASEEGIAPGGSVILFTPPGPKEAAVQLDDSSKAAFMEIQTEQPFSVALENSPFEVQENCKVLLLLVAVHFSDGLSAGEKVTFVWHDIQLDRHARRWGGDSWRFRVFADHDGDGWREELPQVAAISKKTGPAENLLVRCASMALVGEPVRVTVSAFDRFWNPAQEYTGEVRFAMEDGSEGFCRRSIGLRKGIRVPFLFLLLFPVRDFTGSP